MGVPGGCELGVPGWLLLLPLLLLLPPLPEVFKPFESFDWLLTSSESLQDSEEPFLMPLAVVVPLWVLTCLAK